MTRVFLDANLLFSAANRTGITGRLFTEANRRVELVASEGVIDEARRNLTNKRPEWLAGFDQVRSMCRIVPTTIFPLTVTLSDGDRAVLCSAIRTGCCWLVTGDKRDFGPYFDQTIKGVTIIAPLRLAERLGEMPLRGSVPD